MFQFVVAVYVGTVWVVVDILEYAPAGSEFNKEEFSEFVKNSISQHGYGGFEDIAIQIFPIVGSKYCNTLDNFWNPTDVDKAENHKDETNETD